MLLLLDANVLIDYLDGGLAVLGATARHLGTVYVTTAVLDEARRFRPELCLELGITVMEPSLEQILAAGGGGGRLSFQDRLCLMIARENGWTCVTNDGALHRACEKEGVGVLWGLQLMVHLVKEGRLDPTEAVHVAERIREANPRHTTQAILDRFREAVGPGADKP